jgi:hypothetical protein
MLNSGDHMTEYLDQAIQGRDLSIFAPTPTWVSGSIEAVDMRDQTARPKRRRISQACNPCRSRKMRCDGHRPACSRCQKKKGVQCVYEESSLNLKKYGLPPLICGVYADVSDISRIPSFEQHGLVRTRKSQAIVGQHLLGMQMVNP